MISLLDPCLPIKVACQTHIEMIKRERERERERGGRERARERERDGGGERGEGRGERGEGRGERGEESGGERGRWERGRLTIINIGYIIFLTN